MNQKVNPLGCDFVCEWFDFLRTWINSESDEDDCQDTVDCRINGIDSDDSDDDEYDDDKGSVCSKMRPNGHDEHSKVKTTVTCFNCDDNFLFFATNSGWIYCFSRGERQAKGPLYEHHPVKCQIIGIEIPDENVVLLLLSRGFILFNFVRNEIIYSWTLPRSNVESNLLMVTSKCVYDNSRHRYHVFTGDSVGTIRCHNVIEDETITIFNEKSSESEENHHHKIVQIDVYSPDLLLVSSCFRSLILWKNISDSWSAIQIGRNVRKVCGQFGAIFHRDGNTVIASRPSMHLIKANSTDGSVVQTFKLRNVVPLKTLNLFKEPVTLEENHFLTKMTIGSTLLSASSTLSLNNSTSNCGFNFGYLIPIQINEEDYIVSWNSNSLIIIKIDGTLLVKEYSSVKIIDANVSQTDGYRDVIVLREDWTIFRIRFLAKRDYVKSRTNDYGIGEVLKGTLGIQNLSTLPTQALNSLEGEIKKIYTLMSDKIYEGGEKLLNYTSFDQLNVLRRNSSMENQNNTEDRNGLYGKSNLSEISCNDYGAEGEEENFYQPTSPLYIHKKVSRKNSINSKFELDSDKSDEDVLFSRDVEPLPCSGVSALSPSIDDGNDDTNHSGDVGDGDCPQIDLSTSPIMMNHIDDNEINQVNQQPTRKSFCSEIFDLDGLELTKKFSQSSSSSYAFEIKSNMLREGDNIFNGAFSSSIDDYVVLQSVDDHVDSGPKGSESSSSSSVKSVYGSIEETAQTESPSVPIEVHCLPIREVRPIKHVDWQLAIENTHNSGQLEINRFCASGYSDTETSAYVWLSCTSKGRSKLVYYPDFESLRLPPGNNKSFTVGAIRNRIYLLNEDNDLWYREGVDESGLVIAPVLGTLSTRWTKVTKPKSTINLANFSLCTSDQLGWFCDTNGDVWLTKLRTGSWVKISHDPDNRFHVRNVQICPTDSSLVWCIDDNNQLFVRAGIFNTRGDGDEHIGGMAWLPVHTPVEVTSIAVTNNSVWILSNKSFRIFKRIGIQPPSSYVGTDWQEIRSPTLIKDSLKDISASLNGDIWLLTEQGSIWQVCDP